MARGVVARHRERLDVLLQVPDWQDVVESGMRELQLPGRRQGVPFATALRALPLESKYELARHALLAFRKHLRSAVGRRLCHICALERFNDLELDSHLTDRQWQRLRERLCARLAQEHRRYKHAQQLLFTGHQHLIERVVAQTVFDARHRSDCLQEGALALLQAIDRADCTGQDLGAYAQWWIRRHVRNFLMRQRLPVYAPVNLVSRAAARRRQEDAAIDGAAAKSPAEATDDRMAALLLECLRHPAVSLDEPPVGREPALAEVLADPTLESPAEAAARCDLRSLVGRAVEVLTQKQREVLVRRFGLGGGPGSTVVEIARLIGISHQQVSMRERRALERLESVLSPLASEMEGAV